MLKSLQLRRLSTESHFTWQLDVEGLVNKLVKIQIKIPNGCWENSEKLLGLLFCPTLYMQLHHCRPNALRQVKAC